ncbi:MAG: hypothetical protein O7C63_09070 [Alphaproteobacteria bacterium]|nr:hypothetical protein [Alphaproteobacteria bacterium]
MQEPLNDSPWRAFQNLTAAGVVLIATAGTVAQNADGLRLAEGDWQTAVGLLRNALAMDMRHYDEHKGAAAELARLQADKMPSGG